MTVQVRMRIDNRHPSVSRPAGVTERNVGRPKRAPACTDFADVLFDLQAPIGLYDNAPRVIAAVLQLFELGDISCWFLNLLCPQKVGHEYLFLP